MLYGVLPRCWVINMKTKSGWSNLTNTVIIMPYITWHGHKNRQETITRHAYPAGTPEFIPVFSGVRVARSLILCVMFCRSLFVLFLLVIVLSVLWFTDSDYPLVSSNYMYVYFLRYYNSKCISIYRGHHFRGFSDNVVFKCWHHFGGFSDNVVFKCWHHFGRFRDNVVFKCWYIQDLYFL
jgi:hypothetical protein